MERFTNHDMATFSSLALNDPYAWVTKILLSLLTAPT